MYDADILSEDVILKWSEEPLKHRFSCITEKYIIELHDAAEPMIDWLMQDLRMIVINRNEVSGEELSGSGDVVEEGAENVEEEAEEGAEEEVAEEDDDEEEDDDDDEEDDE